MKAIRMQSMLLAILTLGSALLLPVHPAMTAVLLPRLPQPLNRQPL